MSLFRVNSQINYFLSDRASQWTHVHTQPPAPPQFDLRGSEVVVLLLLHTITNRKGYLFSLLLKRDWTLLVLFKLVLLNTTENDDRIEDGDM